MQKMCMNSNINSVSHCTSVWHIAVAFMRPYKWGESIAIEKFWGYRNVKESSQKVELQLRGFNWFTSDLYCNGELTSTQIGLHDTATAGLIAYVNSSN